MQHTHDYVAFLSVCDLAGRSPYLTEAERRHVITTAAKAFLERVRPPAFEAAVRRHLETPVARTTEADNPKPPVPPHPARKVQAPAKGRVAR